MSTVGTPGPAIGLTTISRTVLSVAVEVLHTVERVMVGETAIRTARGNAWEAVCADRARADQRAELERLVTKLTATRSAATEGTPSTTAARPPR